MVTDSMPSWSAIATAARSTRSRLSGTRGSGADFCIANAVPFQAGFVQRKAGSAAPDLGGGEEGGGAGAVGRAVGLDEAGDRGAPDRDRRGSDRCDHEAEAVVALGELEVVGGEQPTVEYAAHLDLDVGGLRAEAVGEVHRDLDEVALDCGLMPGQTLHLEERADEVPLQPGCEVD